MLKDFFCHDLPTSFQPNIGKILVTGASGYIGGRLVPELLARGYKVRVMVRAILPEASNLRLNVTAYFDTQRFLGRVYWYICLPFHHFIFYNLIKEIEKRS